MEIIAKCLNKIEFKQYVADYNFGPIPPNKIVLHHTWKPTIADWNGIKSIEGLKAYYEGKGWSAGPHLFIANDGIWLFTPMNRVGIHAGTGNATYYDQVLRKNVYGFYGNLGDGNWRYNLTECSIGIEMVGDYDAKKPSGEILDYTLFVIKTLSEDLKLAHDAIHFHRDYSTKTCPGAAVTKEWLYKELDEYGKPKGPLEGVPNWFKEGLTWDGKNETLNQCVKLLYQYHQKYHSK